MLQTLNEGVNFMPLGGLRCGRTCHSIPSLETFVEHHINLGVPFAATSGQGTCNTPKVTFFRYALAHVFVAAVMGTGLCSWCCGC